MTPLETPCRAHDYIINGDGDFQCQDCGTIFLVRELERKEFEMFFAGMNAAMDILKVGEQVATEKLIEFKNKLLKELEK